MDPRAIEKAKEHLAIARRAYAEMAAATNLADVAQGWSSLLTESQRFFSKLDAGASGRSTSWSGRIKHERKTDELLQYVHQARHADEHGLDDITEKKPGGVKIAVGGEGVHIDRLEIRGGRIVEAKFIGKPPTIEVIPAEVILKPVVNRGLAFAPPTSHRKKPFNKTTPLSVGNALIEYMDEKLVEACKFANS